MVSAVPLLASKQNANPVGHGFVNDLDKFERNDLSDIVGPLFVCSTVPT